MLVFPQMSAPIELNNSNQILVLYFYWWHFLNTTLPLFQDSMISRRSASLQDVVSIQQVQNNLIYTQIYQNALLIVDSSPPKTGGAIYPSRLFWCEFSWVSFGGFDHRDVRLPSDTVELDDSCQKHTFETLNSNVSFEKSWPGRLR